MASIICKCGYRLSNTMCPNDIEYYVYDDKEWDSILQKDIYKSWEIPLPRLDVWRCPKCERIYVYDENNKLIKRYVLETEDSVCTRNRG